MTAIYRPARFTVDDDVYPEVNNGSVVISGESPNATVRLSFADQAARRYRGVDTIRRASITKLKSGTVKIVGQSDFLAVMVGAPSNDRTLTVEVTPPEPCKDCP